MELDIQTDVPLDRRNTFGLAARAERLVACTDTAQVAAAARLAARHGWPVLVLGGGSNLVLTRDVPGLVIAMASRGIALEGEDDRVRRVRVAAGEVWHALVMETLERGWRGLENLALIPGTVGAAPVQNIGAYGVELDSVFDSLLAVDLADGGLRRFDRAACGFGYRDSRFKREDRGRYAIVEVTFALPVGGPYHTAYADLARELAARGVTAPDARAVAEAVIAIRRAKLPDPARLGNAGSFFKNPVVDARNHARLKADHPGLVSYPQADGTHKLAAGWLIEQAGWKGRSVGDAAVYERQALVLVNRGHATGADVVALAQAIQADIRARFGVALECEPVWV